MTREGEPCSHTLTSHFIRYTILSIECEPVLPLIPHGIDSTVLRDFGPYRYDSMSHFLQVCNVNLLFDYILKVLCMIEI